MFDDFEIRTAVDAVPRDKFQGAGHTQRIDWVKFVASVDEAPKDKHPLMFYVTVARAMAETMGSLHSADYAEGHMRDMVVAGMKVGEALFDFGTETAEWRAVKLLPVHIVFALKVVEKARGKAAAMPAPDPAQTTLTDAIQTYVKVQQAVLDKDRKKDTLSFDLATGPRQWAWTFSRARRSLLRSP